jgi:hypothetical protein
MQCEGKQRLRHRVVELLSQPMALLESQPRLGLLEQASVLDRDGGLISDRPKKTHSSGIQLMSLLVEALQRTHGLASSDHRHAYERRPGEAPVDITTKRGVIERAPNDHGLAGSDGLDSRKVHTGLQCPRKAAWIVSREIEGTPHLQRFGIDLGKNDSARDHLRASYDACSDTIQGGVQGSCVCCTGRYLGERCLPEMGPP